MKTPLTYYGGKQQLAATILALIPEHKVYAEPFVGGAAACFAKEPSRCEVINDTNGELVNFYDQKQGRTPFSIAIRLMWARIRGTTTAIRRTILKGCLIRFLQFRGSFF